MSESQKSTSTSTANASNNIEAITEQFSTVLNTLSSFKSQIGMLSAQVKALEKSVKKKCIRDSVEETLLKTKILTGLDNPSVVLIC